MVSDCGKFRLEVLRFGILKTIPSSLMQLGATWFADFLDSLRAIYGATWFADFLDSLRAIYGATWFADFLDSLRAIYGATWGGNLFWGNILIKFAKMDYNWMIKIPRSFRLKSF